MSLFVQKCALHVSFDYPHGPVNFITLKFFILHGPSIEPFGENRSPNDQSDDKKCRPRQAGGGRAVASVSAARVSTCAIHALVIRKHDVPALVVHVTRGTEPLRANFAAKYARGFDAILRVVCVVAWHGRRRIGEGVKFGAEGIHAGVAHDAFD